MIPIQMTSKISAKHGNNTAWTRYLQAPNYSIITVRISVLPKHIRSGGNNYETFPSEKLSLEHKRPLLLRHANLKCGVCAVAHYLEVITIRE